MSASVEKRAQRRAAAQAWQKEHSGSSRRINAFAFRDDDPDEKIPQHGRRGKGRSLRPDKPALLAVKTSSAFSARLAIGASVSLFWQKVGTIVGKGVSADPGAPRAVLDSNVIVAGLLAPNDKDEASRRLMGLALDDGKVAPLVTWPIIEEYQRVSLGCGDREFKLLHQLLSRSRLVPSSPAVNVPEVPDDPSDTPFLEALALSIRGLADGEQPPTRLVTWDRHLLDMVGMEELDALLRPWIVTPVEFLRRMSGK